MALSSLQRDAVCEDEEMSSVQCFMSEAVNDKCHSFAPTGWNAQPRSPVGVMLGSCAAVRGRVRL